MPSPLLDASAMFGRARELARIDAHLDPATGDDGPRASVIIGVPGIGKTRLVAEHVRHTALPVRRLTGFEPEQSVPLAATAALLRDLASQPIDSAQRLSTLLATGSDHVDGLGALRLFEAATTVALATTPSVLVIDDLQWLDDMSRALVHHIVRAAVSDRMPLVMLCASRPTPDAQAWSASIRGLFAACPDHYDELELTPLDADAGIELARARNPALTADTAAAIWSGAAGSPFWISLQAAGGMSAGEPARVLTSLLRMLGEDAARCLAASVVFARPVSSAALAQVLEWPEARIDAAVGELVRRGLATSRRGVVATTHDLVRESASLDVPVEERTRLHRRISDYLRATAGDDLPMLMEAIEHAVAAGLDATALAIEIVSSPRRRLLGTEGWQRLADVAERPGIDDEQRLRLTELLARLAMELGQHAEALTRLDWLSTALPDRHARAEAALRGAEQAFVMVDADRARELAERARREGADDPWTLIAVDALDFSRLVWLEHDAQTAARCRQRAVGEARRLVAAAGSVDELDETQRSAYVCALDAERTGRLMDDDMDGLLVVAEELVDATRGLGARHLDVITFTTIALRFFNRWAEVAERLVGVVAEATQQVYPEVAAYAAYELALATYNAGDVAAARRLHDNAVRMGGRVDGLRQETSDTWLCGLRQMIDASASDWRAGLEGLLTAATTQDNAHCRLLLHQRAATLAARFDPDTTRDLIVGELEAAAADAAVAQCPRCIAELEIITVEMLARVGETERARRLLDAWLSVRPAPKPRIAFFRDRAIAQLAVHTGDPQGVTLLERLAETAAHDQLQLEQVWAWLDLASVVIEADRDRAITALSSAATLAATLGAASERGLATHRLRELGVRAPASPRSSTTGTSTALALSARESEVARLAARGARNAEIAAALFLSPKTVEQHLSRAFAKLGVRNRAELSARYAEDLDAT